MIAKFPQMRLVRIASVLLIFIGIVQVLSAQQWIEIARDGRSLDEVRHVFAEEWGGRDDIRGNGWKLFKRWEWLQEQRTYPSGTRSLPDNYWSVLQRHTQRKEADSRSSTAWMPLGPDNWTNGNDGYNPGVGRINAIAVDPADSSILYVGSPSGGLWKSTNGGTSWTVLSDDFASLGISAIVIDHTNSDILYIGTGDGDGFDTYSIGILKSTDGGSTWNPTGTLSSNDYVSRRMVMHPSDHLMLYAATSQGLYRTTDGGVSWMLVQSGSMHDVKLHPLHPDTIYAAGKQFYRSTDGGVSFTEIGIAEGLPDSAVINRYRLGVSPSAPDVVYAISGNNGSGSFYGLYRSTDAGASFSLRMDSPNIFGYSTYGSDDSGQSSYNMALAVDPGNANIVYSGAINIWKSTDGGLDFDIKTQWYYPNGFGYAHADIHTIIIHDNTIYAGTDGGIYKSTDGGSSWADLSQGLEITQCYRIGLSPHDHEEFLIGTQDNGTNLHSGGGWIHVYGADGMETAVDYISQNRIYMCTQNGGLRRSLDGGDNFFSITNGINEEGAWVTPFQIDPEQHNILYAAYDNVWKSTDYGSSWSAISGIDGSGLNSLAVAPSNPDVIFTSDNGILYRSVNGGVQWDSVSTPLPGYFITDIEIHQSSPDILWLSFSGYATDHRVNVSIDGGQSWQDYSNGLPPIPVNTIIRQPFSDNMLYAGTDVGVYYRDQAMSQWEPYSTGLPNVIVMELEIQQDTGLLRAASHGRGVWEIPVAGAPPVDRIYVDASESGLHTGLSWNDAYDGLQPALAHAEYLDSPVEIWIASGTYKPHASDRYRSFVIPDGATVIGGFNGTESDLADRNIEANPVVLSGEIGDTGIAVDNTIHVVRINTTDSVGLRDLYVTDGYADVTGQNLGTAGGGLLCLGNAVIEAVSIGNCFALDRASGMLLYGQGVVGIKDVVLEGNTGPSAVEIENGKEVIARGQESLGN